MRAIEEIQKEVAHIKFARSVLDERLTALKAERDQHRADDFAKAKITKRLAEFFKAHGLYIVNVTHGERSKNLYALAKQMWRAWPVLVPFIKRLSANKNRAFVYDTTALSATDRTDLKNLCDMLTKHGWISFKLVSEGFEVTPLLSG